MRVLIKMKAYLKEFFNNICHLEQENKRFVELDETFKQHVATELRNL